MKTRQPFHLRQHVHAPPARIPDVSQGLVRCDDGSVTTMVGAQLGILALDWCDALIEQYGEPGA